MENVKLIGAWPSPFYYRVKWVLELKGIKYEYFEEDLSNKSSMLLESNPVHKKIPVLLHNGKPICESLIILEYIQEVCPHVHPLLPEDPYQRAVARFWAKFLEDKGLAIWMLFRAKGEEEANIAKNDTMDMLRTIEKYCQHGIMGTFIGGEKIGLVDIALGSIIYWLQVLENVLEVKVFEASSFPNLYKWLNNFKEDPIIKCNLPNQDQMFLYFKKQRGILLI